MLNPETSSDSPSAKSKGVRLVSATEITNHSPKSIGMIITFLQNLFLIVIILKFIVLDVIIRVSIIKANLTSYEIVWAIPRRLPISA